MIEQISDGFEARCQRFRSFGSLTMARCERHSGNRTTHAEAAFFSSQSSWTNPCRPIAQEHLERSQLHQWLLCCALGVLCRSQGAFPFVTCFACLHLSHELHHCACSHLSCLWSCQVSQRHCLQQSLDVEVHCSFVQELNGISWAGVSDEGLSVAVSLFAWEKALVQAFVGSCRCSSCLFWHVHVLHLARFSFPEHCGASFVS